MKPILKNALALALPLALAACGGGGGGDNNAPTDTPGAGQPKDNVLLIEPKSGRYIGGFLIKEDDEEVSTANIRDSSNMFLTINGKQYSLPNSVSGATRKNNILIYGSPSGKGGDYVAPDGRSYDSFQVSTSHYRHTQFGITATDGGFAGFYRGVHYKNVPDAGQAVYKGDAIVALSDAKNHFDKTEIGNITANVDFAGKQAQFALISPSYQNAIGASFDSLGIFKGYSNRTAIFGAFYGPENEEMAGEFRDIGRNVTAFFGAKRQ